MGSGVVMSHDALLISAIYRLLVCFVYLTSFLNETMVYFVLQQ